MRGRRDRKGGGGGAIKENGRGREEGNGQEERDGWREGRTDGRKRQGGREKRRERGVLESSHHKCGRQYGARPLEGGHAP